MALEVVSHLDDLVITNPTATDPVSEADDHMRNIKIALASAITNNAAEVRLLVGALVKIIVQQNSIVLDNEANDERSSVQLRNAIGAIRVQVEAATGEGRIEQADADGVSNRARWFSMFRGGGIEAFFNDIKRLATVATGATVTGSLFDLDNSGADAQTESKIRNAIGGWNHGVNATTGRMQIDQISDAGVFELIQMTMERAGKCGFRFNGVEVLQTADATTTNSGALVKDAGGINRPVGFNTMPLRNIAAGRTIIAADNGFRLRYNSTSGVLTLADVLIDMAVNVYSLATLCTLIVPSGITLRFYDGSAQTIFTGSTTVDVSIGAAFTLVQNSAVQWDCWGGGLS